MWGFGELRTWYKGRGGSGMVMGSEKMACEGERWRRGVGSGQKEEGDKRKCMDGA